MSVQELSFDEDEDLAEGEGEDEDLDPEEIVTQGFRQTRERTNWLYRGTAMTTTDLMDIDSIRRQVIDYQDALSYIGGIFAGLTVLATTRLQQNLISSYNTIKKVIQLLSISIAWIACYIELLYLDIEDRLYFVHRIRRFTTHQNRTIDDITDDNVSFDLFGFRIQELRDLLVHWRIPIVMRMGERHFTGEESMLIFLHYIRTGTPFTRMASHTFGGDPRRFSYYVRAMADHLYNTFYHKISGDSMRQWLPFISDFRTAIWDELQAGIVEETRADGTQIDYEVNLPLATFRIFGWIDDTDLQTDRPREGRSGDLNDELRDTQQAFYK